MTALTNQIEDQDLVPTEPINPTIFNTDGKPIARICPICQRVRPMKHFESKRKVKALFVYVCDDCRDMKHDKSVKEFIRQVNKEGIRLEKQTRREKDKRLEVEQAAKDARDSARRKQARIEMRERQKREVSEYREATKEQRKFDKLLKYSQASKSTKED
ncbi:MAG TPA: hypothetical protein VFC84_14750 [Desulfosporosinus sp.]|nr:hypothetical protein [Desulfosporosinus sp.]